MSAEVKSDKSVISWVWKDFDALSGSEVHQMLWLRQRVFVVEQSSLYCDPDQWDSLSDHLFGYDLESNLNAYARLSPPGTKYSQVGISRVVIAPAARGMHLGHDLMLQCIERARQFFPDHSIKISAQVYLKSFYQRLGFHPTSDIYDDAGVAHLDMMLNNNK